MPRQRILSRVAICVHWSWVSQTACQRSWALHALQIKKGCEQSPCHDCHERSGTAVNRNDHADELCDNTGVSASPASDRKVLRMGYYAVEQV